MALTNFGAIMAFAADMAAKTGEHYRALAQAANDAAIKEHLEDLAREETKNRSRIEESRRMNVTEMILEPVAGLFEESYTINVKIPDAPSDADVLGQAAALEEREKKFFQDVSARVPLPEVARFFRKIAEKKERSLSRIESMRAERASRQGG